MTDEQKAMVPEAFEYAKILETPPMILLRPGRAVVTLAALCIELRDTLYQMTDEGQCYLDHHGYCQEHGYLDDGECPHAIAKRLLVLLQEVDHD